MSLSLQVLPTASVAPREQLKIREYDETADFINTARLPKLSKLVKEQKVDALVYPVTTHRQIQLNLNKVSLDEKETMWEIHQHISLSFLRTRYDSEEVLGHWGNTTYTKPEHMVEGSVTLSHPTRFKYLEVWARLRSKYQKYKPVEVVLRNEALHMVLQAQPDLPDLDWELEIRMRGGTPEELLENSLQCDMKSRILFLSSKCRQEMSQHWKKVTLPTSQKTVLYRCYPLKP